LVDQVWLAWLTWFGWLGWLGCLGLLGWLGWLGLAVEIQQSVPFSVNAKLISNYSRILENFKILHFQIDFKAF
jgi:hypothetical protein